MSDLETNSSRNFPNQQLAAEVLELGESLFEIALEVVNPSSSLGEEGEAYPVEELRAATNEFFTALRLLLSIEQ